MDEKSALRALRQRDERALGWFIDRYSPYVWTIVRNIIGAYMTEADAEEVASDVFLTLWTNAERIRPGKAKAYLSGLARNKALEKTRALGLDLPLEEDALIISNMDVERDLAEREQAEFLRRAVLAMAQPEREIFLRHYYYCQSVARIAEETGLNPSTVKTKLRRGRLKLRQILREGGYDLESEDIRHDGAYRG